VDNAGNAIAASPQLQASFEKLLQHRAKMRIVRTKIPEGMLTTGKTLFGKLIY